jgi:2-C-methyl-D-erythritol 4-phosphate cytidylyltransferase
MEGGKKKEYRNIGDKPVLALSILPFIQLKNFTYISVTLPPAHELDVKELLKPYLNIQRIKFITGGKTRQESVYLGLKDLGKQKVEFVLIHDGARPWIDKDTIGRVLEGCMRAGACIPVISAQDALKKVGRDGFILKHLKRETNLCAQTPQGFYFSDILKAHKLGRKENRTFIDDAEAYAAYIGPVYTVTGNIKNRKITFKHDME